MKKLLVLFIAVFTLIACNETTKKEGFTISGKIDGYTQGDVKLLKRSDGEFVTIDSTNVDSLGTFVIEGKIDAPELVYIQLGNTRNYMQFFIENAEINIDAQIDSLNKASITGSESQNSFVKYLDGMEAFQEESQQLYQQWMEAKTSNDTIKTAEIEAKYEELSEKQKAYDKQFVKNNTSSVVSPYITYASLIYDFDLDQLKETTNSFDSTLNNTVYIKYLQERIAILEKTAPGQPIIDFELNDTTGNPIALSSFKGKYLLVDFWASWCGPCRRENPNVVKLYNQYKDKGFEIFGVSFDESREAWIKAIKDDGLIWPQVSDLKGWGCEAGKLYGVRSIPHTMLVDPDGIIIEHNLRGDELEAKLAEIFAD